MFISIIFKTLFMYFFIILVYRIMGKKELGQLSIVDLIVSILIAELIAVGIESKNSIFISIIPIIVLTIVQMSVSYLTIKSDKIRNIIEGKPIVIIKNGKINFSSMKKLRYSLDDLLTQLRLQGIKSIDKVKYAILENNGNLSIFSDNSDYPLPLILDGIIDYDVLKDIDKDCDWLLNMIRKKNIELIDIFYAFYTSNKLFIIEKSELL